MSIGQSRRSAQQQDAALAFDVIEPGRALFEGLGIYDIVGFDALLKGQAFESKPGEEIFQGMPLPL